MTREGTINKLIKGAKTLLPGEKRREQLGLCPTPFYILNDTLFTIVLSLLYGFYKALLHWLVHRKRQL